MEKIFEKARVSVASFIFTKGFVRKRFFWQLAYMFPFTFYFFEYDLEQIYEF